MKKLLFLICFAFGFISVHASNPLVESKRNPSSTKTTKEQKTNIETEPTYEYGQISKIVLDNGDVLYPCKKRNRICSKKTPCPNVSMQCPVAGGVRLDLYFAEGIETIMAQDFILFSQELDEETGEVYNVFKIIY